MSEEKEICPKCGAANDKSNKFCENCGSGMSTNANQFETDDFISCKKCGFKNKKTEKFCKECGQPLTNEAIRASHIKPFMFFCSFEIMFFTIVTVIVSSSILFEIMKTFTLDDNRIMTKAETVFQQIQMSLMSQRDIFGLCAAAILGTIVVLSLWCVFKFNRLEKRILEIQELIKRS